MLVSVYIKIKGMCTSDCTLMGLALTDSLASHSNQECPLATNTNSLLSCYSWSSYKLHSDLYPFVLDTSPIHRKVYGCTDSNAVNYDPYANALYDELETCPAQTGTDHCVTCSYSSYNNSKGYSYSLPEDTLDYYGMPMNLSEPDPSMYNRSYTYP
jgi:hypothetical protein